MRPAFIWTVTISMLCSGAPARGADNPKVAAEIIGMVRSDWDGEIKGTTVSGQGSTVADDYTEFSHDLPLLISGKPQSDRFSSAPSDAKTLYSEMLNPKAQVYGDTAILTYNYLGYFRERDGGMSKTLEDATRVYVRQNGRWMLVHAHFSVAPSVNRRSSEVSALVESCH